MSGTQGVAPIALWSLAAAAAAVICLPGPAWSGPLVLAVVLGAAVGFARHCATRFGGMNGDVLGAVSEGTATAVAVAAAILL